MALSGIALKVLPLKTFTKKGYHVTEIGVISKSRQTGTKDDYLQFWIIVCGNPSTKKNSSFFFFAKIYTHLIPHGTQP
ncbi:hypothetical protein [Lacrimispora celerecrescens]|uniref:hypothetical protein n=1 Tax=Lacrimispora celerecrescens TaxID=29354 RepID=UPI000ADDB523|nr:hypothetical protein [Lacrimispora celerecrescens]